MSDIIRAKVAEILDTAGVAYSARYITETNQGEWKCDQWFCTFTSGKTSEHFDYFTGLGHRETVSGFKAVHMPGARMIKGHWQATKPKAPDAASVLYCLILDSSACDQSFSDWCADYGYDTDSRKALETYLSCQASAEKMKRIFSHDVLAQLRDALQDY